MYQIEVDVLMFLQVKKIHNGLENLKFNEGKTIQLKHDHISH